MGTILDREGRERFTEKLISEWRLKVEASLEEVQVWDQQREGPEVGMCLTGSARRSGLGWSAPSGQGLGWGGHRG